MERKDLHVVYMCFPGGKHKVLTMSYDDGRPEDRRLVELFNDSGIKGTFNVNSGLTMDDRIPMSEYCELYRGHEIACHTYHHPTLARCPMEQVVQQIIEDRRKLEEAVGYPIRGLAYPNGSWNDDIVSVLPSLGIKYARTVTSTGSFAMPTDYLKWGATCHHNDDLLEYAKQFTELRKPQYLYMMYVWGHSYEFTLKNNWKVMEEFCKLTGKREDIWYATNIQIVDYMDAAKRMEYSAAGDFVYNPSVQSVWIQVEHIGEQKKLIECKGGEITKLF